MFIAVYIMCKESSLYFKGKYYDMYDVISILIIIHMLQVNEKFHK